MPRTGIFYFVKKHKKILTLCFFVLLFIHKQKGKTMLKELKNKFVNIVHKAIHSATDTNKKQSTGLSPDTLCDLINKYSWESDMPLYPIIILCILIAYSPVIEQHIASILGKNIAKNIQTEMQNALCIFRDERINRIKTLGYSYTDRKNYFAKYLTQNENKDYLSMICEESDIKRLIACFKNCDRFTNHFANNMLKYCKPILDKHNLTFEKLFPTEFEQYKKEFEFNKYNSDLKLISNKVQQTPSQTNKQYPDLTELELNNYIDKYLDNCKTFLTPVDILCILIAHSPTVAEYVNRNETNTVIKHIKTTQMQSDMQKALNAFHKKHYHLGITALLWHHTNVINNDPNDWYAILKSTSDVERLLACFQYRYRDTHCDYFSNELLDFCEPVLKKYNITFHNLFPNNTINTQNNNRATLVGNSKFHIM